MATCAILSDWKCFLWILRYLYKLLELVFTGFYQSKGVLATAFIIGFFIECMSMEVDTTTACTTTGDRN